MFEVGKFLCTQNNDIGGVYFIGQLEIDDPSTRS
ncbi:hypothetical protein AHFPHNDE_03876 [Pseudomonas sp. MM227]|nr:hypothetical protein AHFPHNDE_03876 [Pseudomonas sp. MM227]